MIEHYNVSTQPGWLHLRCRECVADGREAGITTFSAQIGDLVPLATIYEAAVKHEREQHGDRAQ